MMDKVRTGYIYTMIVITFAFAEILEVLAGICYAISKACIIIRFMWIDCYDFVNQWNNNLIDLKKDLPLFTFQKPHPSVL